MPSLDQNPAANNKMRAAGSSEIYKYGMSPDSRAVISQKIRLLTPSYGGDAGQRYQLGVVSSFSYSGGSRSTEVVRGIGFGDVVADRVPGVTEPFTGTITRTLLYLSNMFQALGFAGGVDGPVRSVAHTRWPFDMEEQMVFTFMADDQVKNGGFGDTKGLVNIDFAGQNVSKVETNTAYNNQQHKALITFFEGCWLTGVDIPGRDADSSKLEETGNVDITDVHDLFTTYGEFLATGGYGNSVRTRRTAGLDTTPAVGNAATNPA